MKVADLFCGLKGWSEPFLERGHEVWTTDIEPKFKPDLAANILDLTPDDFPWRPDVLLASPPCEKFSTGGFHGHHFEMDQVAYPVTPQGELALEIVFATVTLIETLKPRFFVIENPRALLRKTGVLDLYDRRTVWYCHLGEDRAKPTDIWGGFPPSLYWPSACHNQRANHPSDCCCRDHNAAPRGSVTGTQGMKTDEAAKIPRQLATLICIGCEMDLERAA